VQTVWSTIRALATTHVTNGADPNDMLKRWTTTVRPKGKALVDNWECLKEAVHLWEKSCGALGTYGMRQASRVFSNICNDGIPAKVLGKVAESRCSPGDQHPEIMKLALLDAVGRRGTS
jgi:hypothetical protein